MNCSTNSNQIEKLKKILYKAIEEVLTDRQKEILIIYYFEEKTMEQIAEELNINKSTVSRTLQRAEKNLKKIAKILEDVA